MLLGPRVGWTIVVSTTVLFLPVATACSRLGVARRYLSVCPAEGPEATDDLGIRVIPFDLASYYSQLTSSSVSFGLSEVGRVSHAGAEYQILRLHRQGAAPRWKMLVIAGIHGNETAAVLAVPRIVERLSSASPRYERWSLDIVTPANPVGLAHASRYNGDGCDINRDFGDFRTAEAGLIRDLIVAHRPDVIVSLHEGPQDGFFLVVTSAGSQALGEVVVSAIDQAGIELATHHFVGFSLGIRGLSAEGRLSTFAKRAFRLNTLGSYANQQGIPTYTTETNWSSLNFEERINSHVIAVEALIVAGLDSSGTDKY